MRGPQFHSLRWRLSLAITAVVVLCTAACVAASVLFLRQALTDRATSDLRHSLRGVTGYLEDQRDDLLGSARLIAQNPELGSAARQHSQSGVLLAAASYYGDLNLDVLDVIDRKGHVVLRMENTGLPAGDYVGDRGSIRAALSGNEGVGFEGDPHAREQAGGYGLRASEPIRRGNAVVGVISVGRLLNDAYARRFGHALNADVNLIVGGNRTGTTLVDSYGLPTTGEAEPTSVIRRIQEGRTSIAQETSNGSAVLSGIVPLRGSNGRYVGAVEIVRPLEPVFDVIRLLTFLLILLGALVVVVGTFLALYVARRLTERLQVLEATASSVAALASTDAPLARYHVSPPIDGKDEVSSLARSFSQMMQALDARMAANADLYTAAQARVRELTGLAEIARLLTAMSSVQETMNLLGQHVSRLVGCPAVSIWLPDDKDGATLFGGHGLPPNYETSVSFLLASDEPWFETAAQQAMRTGQVVSRDLRNLANETKGVRRDLHLEFERLGIDAAVAVPLRVQDRIVGSLTCYTAISSPPSVSDISLLTTIADQVAVAVESARLNARARDLAALEERQRLARELHDSVSQSLFGIALGAQTARTLLDEDPASAREPLEYLLVQAQAGLADMRALIFELRPEALELEGLSNVLQKQVEAMRQRHAIDVEADISPEPDVPLGVKEALFRIAQESFHNMVKHASATQAEIRLDWDDRCIMLAIRDNGRGFDTSAVPPERLGLTSMQERAASLGGSVTIDSRPGQGTAIQVTIPRVHRSEPQGPGAARAQAETQIHATRIK